MKEWCRQYQIRVANYYYRLRQVSRAYLESLPEEPASQSVVPVPSELMVNVSSTSSCLEMKVNDIRLRVTEVTTPELLKMVLLVLADVKGCKVL